MEWLCEEFKTLFCPIRGDADIRQRPRPLSDLVDRAWSFAVIIEASLEANEQKI